jgi:hypothetical protein
MINERVQHLINTIDTQFDYRTTVEGKKHNQDYGISLKTSVDDNNVLWMSFAKDGETHNITFPLPFEENGVQLIQQNEVLRAVCPFWLEESQSELDYLATMYYIVLDSPVGIIPAELVKATPFLQQMIYGFNNGNASIIAYRFQRAINEVVNRMPLHETFVNSFVMNHRLIIIDPAFEQLASPGERLAYQTSKAVKYFDRGWTPIGLADGALADKNYILQGDIRTLSPFGMRYHNPQRNLYSTLGMKGEELPLIRSRSMQNLMDKGVTRKGWNLFTAFVDIPDIFEDQIMLDKSFVEKSVEYERRYQVFGDLVVKELDNIKTGDVIGFAPDEESIRFKVLCDHAVVRKIAKSTISVGGTSTPVHNVVIAYRRKFCDGFKLTNLHGNKGVVRLMDLGYAIDPRTGERRKLDVIVGAKTVGKRKNYGQIMEAVFNCCLEADANSGEREPTIVENDFYQPVEEIEAGLVRRGFRKDGTWDCDTYAGKVKAVCGTVFWGCIKTPHDQIWQDGVTAGRNGKDVRTAGLKFSHVEFRALETRFGVGNPVVDEIMSYVQGSENLHEMLDMIRSKTGVVPKGKIVLDINSVRPIDQNGSTIVGGQYIGGTVVDEFFQPDGFVFQLPLAYQTLVDEKGEVLNEGSALMLANLSPEQRATVSEVFTTDKLYFPSGLLRKCWRHDTGKFGLSEIGVLVNNVVVMSHRLVAAPDEALSLRLYFNALFAYFDRLAKMMGSKRGEIATYAMAVRYPFAAKAGATLSTTLPKNTVEIHRDMANQMKVKNGDVVLAERFPCLGFVSVRPQKVRVTDDPMCKYTIRASGNSLVSTNLDFDGDILFLAAFHTAAAKLTLNKEWANPNQTCYAEIQKLNERKGAPHIKEYNLQDFNITPFADLTNEKHAEIVEKNTGVKAQTGPVIALTYNIMRIVENSELENSQKMRVAMEMFLEKAAQSVFEQKHGGKSLYEIVIDGVCTADIEMLVNVGFKRGTTEKLCALVTQRANGMGIFDLVKFHNNAKERGGSNLISRIVRQQNRIYFASRSSLEGIALLKALEAPAVDIPSRMFKWVMAGKHNQTKTILEKVMTEDKVKELKAPRMQAACLSLCDLVDNLFAPKEEPEVYYRRKLREGIMSVLKEGFDHERRGDHRP